MNWATESELKRALEELQERYPGEKLEIISTFDIANVGWECDSRSALILRDDVPELVIIDQTGGDERTVREILEAKVGEYERLAAETRSVLGQLLVLEGLPRRVIGVEELSEQELQMVMRSRVEHSPELEDEVVRGTGDPVTDLGLPEISRTLWALIRGLNTMLEDMRMTPAEFAKDAGFPMAEVERLCDGVVDPQNVARLIEIYDAASSKTGWRTVREMIGDEIESHEKTDPGDDR